MHSVLGPAKHGDKDSACPDHPWWPLAERSRKVPITPLGYLEFAISTRVGGHGSESTCSFQFPDGELRPEGEECIHDTGFHM